MSVDAVTITYLTASCPGDASDVVHDSALNKKITVHYVPWVASIAQMAPDILKYIKSNYQEKNTQELAHLLKSEHDKFIKTPHLSGWYSGEKLSAEAIELVRMVRRHEGPIPMELSRSDLTEMAKKRFQATEATAFTIKAEHQLIDVKKRSPLLPHWHTPLIAIWFCSGIFSFAKGLQLLIGGMSFTPALAAIFLSIYSMISLASYSYAIPRYLTKLQRWIESKFYNGGQWTVGAFALSAAIVTYVLLKIILQVSGTTASFSAAGGVAAWLPTVAPLCGAIHGFFKTLFDAENWESSWYKTAKKMRYEPPLSEITHLEDHIKSIYLPEKKDAARNTVLTYSHDEIRAKAATLARPTMKDAFTNTDEAYISWTARREAIEGTVHSPSQRVQLKNVATSTLDLASQPVTPSTADALEPSDTPHLERKKHTWGSLRAKIFNSAT